MIDRRVAEEIPHKAAQAVSETSFCEFNARCLAVNLELTPVLELAALTQDQEVRRLNGRASVLPCAGPSWRYALVQTPAQYLDHGDNYDRTAEGLTINRSTLRHRLNSIRQITCFDLTDPLDPADPARVHAESDVLFLDPEPLEAGRAGTFGRH